MIKSQKLERKQLDKLQPTSGRKKTESIILRLGDRNQSRVRTRPPTHMQHETKRFSDWGRCALPRPTSDNVQYHPV